MAYHLQQRLDSVKYTIDHRKAFRQLELQLLGYNTIRSLFHDLDKIFLKLILPSKIVSKLHRYCSRHHSRACTQADYIQMAIDWECARFTKPDKPLNARETLEAYYPERKDVMLPVIESLGL